MSAMTWKPEDERAYQELERRARLQAQELYARSQKEAPPQPPQPAPAPLPPPPREEPPPAPKSQSSAQPRSAPKGGRGPTRQKAPQKPPEPKPPARKEPCPPPEPKPPVRKEPCSPPEPKPPVRKEPCSPAPPMPLAPLQTPPPRKGKAPAHRHQEGLLGALPIQEDQLLLGILLYILIREKADQTLILAILYILFV